MPWYPGIGGPYVSGYWDGRRWKAALTDEYLMLDGQWFGLDEIVSVRYSARYYVPTGSQRARQMLRDFAVSAGDGRKAEFSSGSRFRDFDRNHEDLWQGLADISRNVIEPRLARKVLRAVGAGQAFVCEGSGGTVLQPWYGHLRVLASGFTVQRRLGGGEVYNWSELAYVEVKPYGNWPKARVWVRRPMEPQPRVIIECFLSQDNAVLLDTLMALCAAEFGGYRR